MPILNDRRVLWHPRRSNKFIVGGGSQITLYELSSEQPEIRHVTAQHDLQFMKCFAWSPESFPSDVLAVGTSSGRVDLLRLEASRYSQLGSNEDSLSSGPILSLPVRNQRSCNALAFSPSDPNYLAVGLDKVRGDGSLVIWDVQGEMSVFRAENNDDVDVTVPYSKDSSGKLNTYPPIPRSDLPLRTDQRMVQAHAQTELISSLAWLPQSSHPYLLLAGVSPRWLRLFDLRTPSGSGAGASYVSSVAAKVSGIATDPFDPMRFASWGDGVITVWDARKLSSSRIHSNPTNGAPSPTPLLVFTEKEAGADGALSPSLSANPKPSTSSPSTSSKRSSAPVSSTTSSSSNAGHPPGYTMVEFSSARRGMLASLAKDAVYVRLWDVVEGAGSYPHNEPESFNESLTRSKSRDKLPISRKSWANLPWGSGGTSAEIRAPSPILEDERTDQTSRQTALILHNTRRAFSRNDPTPLCSFAMVPPIYPSHRTRSKMVVVAQTGEIALQSVYDSPRNLAWSARGEMLYGPLESSSTVSEDIGGFGIATGYHSGEEEEERALKEEVHEVSLNRAASSNRRSKSASKSYVSREERELRERGRTRNSVKHDGGLTSPALFGRGDAEGFPALSRPSSVVPGAANLAATKPLPGVADSKREDKERRRTFSPSTALRVPLHQTAVGSSSALHESPAQRSSSKTADTRKQLVDRKETAHSVVADDISMVMWRRAIRGYCIRDPIRNASVIHELASASSSSQSDMEEMSSVGSTEAKMLAKVWEWLYHSEKFLSAPTPLLRGYDFSYAGVWGIWDGPPEVGGSGTIPRVMDPDPHALPVQQAAMYPSDVFESRSATSGSSTSGSLSSSITSGSTSASPSSSLGIGAGSVLSSMVNSSESSSDADATPMRRDRLELPSVLDSTLLGYDRSRRGPKTTAGSRRRTRSPAVDPLINAPEWHAALLALFSRTPGPHSTTLAPPSFPYTSTSRPLQRYLCLQLIGWGFVLRDEWLLTEVRRWERESEGDEGYARAAAWLAFTGRYGGGLSAPNEGPAHGEGAIECLLRSEDETHHMMSGVIAALAPFASSTLSSYAKPTLPSSLREHYARLINKLQNPYLRALLTHLTTVASSGSPSAEHWLEILHDEADLLPFCERLALAFCFLDDAALTTYLRRCREHAVSKNGGDIDALVVTGLGTSEGKDVLGRWLDRWGDFQTAAILGWMGVGLSLGSGSVKVKGAARFKGGNKPSSIDSRVNRWVEAYRDFLDALKLFHCRVEFDIERGEVLQALSEQGSLAGLDKAIVVSAPRQILIRCNYCNKTITPDSPSGGPNHLGLGLDSLANNNKPTACPNCSRPLPRCSICLMTLGIVQDSSREAELAHSRHRDTIDDAIIICQNCRHGGHASHILEWFFGNEEADGHGAVSHRVCAVADCNCQCANEF